MNRKYMCLISVILLLGVVGNTTAAYNQYSGTYDGDWTTAANWDLGYVPTTADKTGFKTVGGPLVVTSTPTCDQWTLGGVNGGIVTIDTGGTVETLGRVRFAQSSNEDGTLVMNDGTATFGGILDLGYVGTGHIDLNGGTINAADFRMRELGGVGTMDIHEGTLIIGGDKTILVNGYISSGWITAYGGMGNVIVTYDGGSDSTMLTGIMDPNKAKLPYPTNNAVDVAPYVVLTWVPGDTSVTHDIYFGTDETSVSDANTSTVGIYQGSQVRNANTFEPTGLELGKKYYWRIDEVNEPDVYKGNLWQFTVADYALVDDFEEYADPNDMLVSWSNVGTGGALSLATSGGHDGAQTMKFDYDNSSDPNYSEAQTADVDYDWTIAGVLAIDIWYKGDTGNAAEQMYAALEDDDNNPVAVVENSDLNAAKAADWQVWRIELSDFTGVNLGNIKKFYIGFGDRTNPVAGGTGTVYFDDIRLHPTRCLNKPLEDLDDDCDVDFQDFSIMAKNWLGSSPI